jgi:hypothetical protein
VLCFIPLTVEVSKKIKKPIKPRKPEKTNNRKNQTVKKNLLKFWKKLTGSVRFWFYKPETEPNRTKPKPKNTGKKPSQTGKNQAKPGKNRVKLEKPSQTGFFPKITEQNRNRSVCTGFGTGFGYFFLIKTEPNQK